MNSCREKGSGARLELRKGCQYYPEYIDKTPAFATYEQFMLCACMAVAIYDFFINMPG